LKVSILGSTGSIGTQALDVCEKLGYTICVLTANSNVKLLEEQIRRYKPDIACLMDERLAKELAIKVKDCPVTVLSGEEGLCEAASYSKADVVLNSVVGMVGLKPTLAAIEAGKTIALANKETLVAGGHLVTQAAQKKGVAIYPVDSEHSAIFQSLQGSSLEDVKRIILTASGGPFFGYTKEKLQNITPADALKHPNWSMGSKITIDSATMMNKGLELIEAVWLFNTHPDNIDIVVHRESVVHSLVEFADHSVIAQLGVPDMRIPIQYALTYPKRVPSPVKQLNLSDYTNLSFHKPDYDTFSCINHCKEAIARGGLYPAVVNGANEMAVALFLEKKISFLQIGDLVGEALTLSVKKDDFTLDDVLAADKEARAFVLNKAGGN